MPTIQNEPPTDAEFAAAAVVLMRYISDIDTGYDRERAERVRRFLKEAAWDLEDRVYTAGTSREKS